MWLELSDRWVNMSLISEVVIRKDRIESLLSRSRIAGERHLSKRMIAT